jgi:hypothetical protein
MEHNTVCEWMDDLEYNILSVSIPNACNPFTTRRDAVKGANKVDILRYISNVCMGTDFCCFGNQCASSNEWSSDHPRFDSL